MDRYCLLGSGEVLSSKAILWPSRQCRVDDGLTGKREFYSVKYLRRTRDCPFCYYAQTEMSSYNCASIKHVYDSIRTQINYTVLLPTKRLI